MFNPLGGTAGSHPLEKSYEMPKGIFGNTKPGCGAKLISFCLIFYNIKLVGIQKTGQNGHFLL